MILGARNSMLSGKHWKNPYITDGLVAMWDGEWNAGGGVHDANATTWKQLVAGSQYGDITTGVLGVNIWDMRGKKCTLYGNFATPRTVELVVAGSVQDLTSYYPINFGQARGDTSSGGLLFFRLYNNTLAYIYKAGSRNGTRGSVGTSARHLVAVITSSTGSRCYYNGVAATGLSSLNYDLAANYDTVVFNFLAGSAQFFEWYALRIYSRALTSNEVAANYAIDQARFNLP